MSAITVLLVLVIIATLIGHGALYYTRPKNSSQPQKKELLFVHDPVVRSKEPSGKIQAPAIDNPELRVLKDKVGMAHVRLDNLERSSYSENMPSSQHMLTERIRKLENTAENNKIDLFAIKQILQDIQSKIK